MFVERFLFFTVVVMLIAYAEGGYGFSSNDKILLTDINVLTLYPDKLTSARRSHPVKQLMCVGGTAGCDRFRPDVVQCYNRGSDGIDTQWECKTEMDNAFKFGRTLVNCEGYDYPDDPYVLKGSCGLEYTVDLTHSGHGEYQSSQPGRSYDSFGAKPNNYKGLSSWIGNIVFLVVIGVIIYVIYVTCLGGLGHGTGEDSFGGDQRRSGWNEGGGSMPGSQSPRPPPPPGFKDEYMPRDDCSANRNSYSSSGGSSTFGQSAGAGGGGFWTGAAAGGILGYIFGNRNQQPTYSSPYSFYQRPSNPSAGWFSNPTHQSSYSSPGSSSYSTGTRTASGYGGTKRR